MKCRLKLECKYDNPEHCMFCPPYIDALETGKLTPRKWFLTDKTKRQISKSLKGKRKGILLSLEHRIKLSDAHKGKKFSEQHCRNLSKSLKGKTKTGRKPWSDEHKKMLSDILKGRKHKYPATRKKRVKNGSTQ
jgi:hypothetical protein